MHNFNIWQCSWHFLPEEIICVPLSAPCNKTRYFYLFISLHLQRKIQKSNFGNVSSLPHK